MTGSRRGVRPWRRANHMQQASSSEYDYHHNDDYYPMAPKSSKKAMMATDTTYGMSMDMPAKQSKSRRHRRGNSNQSEDADPSDGSASLTYSAGSSIASSAAGESTDSSFADIMRVLDVQDSNELAAFMKREGVTDPSQYRAKANKASTISVASSLNYSTDGESQLEGTKLLQTITGQPSDSYGPDGGGFGDLGNDILFAAADEPVKRKGRKDKSSRSKHSSSPKASRSHGHKRTKSSSSNASNNTKTTGGSSNPSTPPPVPRSRSHGAEGEGGEDEDEVWYAKWWMCGFADSFRDLVPKR